MLDSFLLVLILEKKLIKFKKTILKKLLKEFFYFLLFICIWNLFLKKIKFARTPQSFYFILKK
jgi:hypothetical protein